MGNGQIFTNYIENLLYLYWIHILDLTSSCFQLAMEFPHFLSIDLTMVSIASNNGKKKQLSRTASSYMSRESLCKDFSMKAYSLKCTLITRNTCIDNCKIVKKNKSNNLTHPLSHHSLHLPISCCYMLYFDFLHSW